ncbi:uncharacterized protein [Diadema setosum]|uniref:uncharacterized protein n=1 Tax=Diadema setosum TaxID=31175 RepID=UPI003B3B27B8
MADSMDGDPMGEDYEGMGTSPSKLGESNSSPQGVILSRLSTSSRRRHMTDSTSSSSASSKITDEDLLNTLFQSCDTENVGRVPASQLIECIQMIVLPSDIEAEQHLENLAQTLDPTGLNMSVDLQTYHDRISMWVASLKNQNSGLSEGDDNLNTIQEEDAGPPHGSPVWKSRRKVDTSLATDTSLNVSAFSYGSLEAYGGDTDNKPSYQDRMAELRHNNRMLADHNKDLQAQLETTEESRMELLRQCEEAEEKIKSLGGRNASLREEIKELHLETSGLQDMNSELKSKVLDLEKEKMSLESTIHLLENEDRDNILLHEKIQFLEEEHSRAQTEIRTKDTKLSESKNRLQSIQIQFLEKKKRYDDLHQSHRELQDAFKLLKMEKSDIEQELSQVHQKMTSSLAGLGLKAPVTPDLTGEFPQLQSTPDEHNLQSELRIFVAESHLPSPIYGPVTYETGGKSEMMQKLHSTTESIIAEVEKMVTVQQEDASAEDRDFLGQTITKLRSQLESLLCNMKWVMEAKKNSDHRAIKMGEDLKAVRDENHRLKQSRDSGDGMDSLNHRLSQIQNELELSRAEVEIMEFTAKRDQQKITDLESMCLLLQKELDVTRFDLKTQTSGLEEHVQMRYKAEEELEDTRRLLAEAQTELDCLLEAGLNEAEPSSAAGLPQNAREQPDFPTTGPARDLEDVVRSLQLANQELGQEGEVFEQSFDDVDLVVPTLDSGYRTATSLTQGLVPVKNGQRLLTHSPPQHLSAIIGELAYTL